MRRFFFVVRSFVFFLLLEMNKIHVLVLWHVIDDKLTCGSLNEKDGCCFNITYLHLISFLLQNLLFFFLCAATQMERCIYTF